LASAVIAALDTAAYPLGPQMEIVHAVVVAV
jgi:hypothetical protein